jgi:class 3 adenylate cyclase
MPQDETELRKLAAIMFTDMVGYMRTQSVRRKSFSVNKAPSH